MEIKYLQEEETGPLIYGMLGGHLVLRPICYIRSRRRLRAGLLVVWLLFRMVNILLRTSFFFPLPHFSLTLFDPEVSEEGIMADVIGHLKIISDYGIRMSILTRMSQARSGRSIGLDHLLRSFRVIMEVLFLLCVSYNSLPLFPFLPPPLSLCPQLSRLYSEGEGEELINIVVDPTCRFMTVASGDRGWAGESTKVVLIHEIKW
jgi:hypothetical protein